MRWIAFLLVVMLCGTGSFAAESELRAGPVSLEYRESGGARVTLAGVPIVRASSIQLHAPDWKRGYYSSTSSPRKIKIDDASRTITVEHSADKHVTFNATETYRIIDDGRIEITLRGRLDTDMPAKLEWGIGYVNAFPLYGGSVRDIWKPGEESRAIVPQPPMPSDHPAIASDTRAIRLTSRAGWIECRIESPEDVRLTLLDGRLAPQRWWAQETPTLWLGATGIGVESGKPFELKAVLTFKPEAEPYAGQAKMLDVEPLPSPRVYESPQRQLHVIPKPRRMTVHDERIVLPNDTVIVGAAAGELLSRELNERFGLTTRAASASNFFPESNRPEIIYRRGPAGSMEPEGYTIRCGPDGIEIRAMGAAGFRHATHTLLQLVRPMPDGGGAYIPACEIDDAPSLAFRGVHIFPGKDSLDFHRRLIENVIARHKFNHVVLECEYTQWDSARGIWVDFSMPKDQIRDYVKMIRENGLEPIPLVQSLGHSWWMFRNDQNLDLAEDPEMPRAYDATNPKTYEFLDRIYEEALELFGQVKYFHIGHDEITLFGRYPHREESKKWGVTKLFLSDIQHWIDFFRPRDIRIMIWGDMLLAKEEIEDGAAFGDCLEEARRRRESLPKDVVICDWHYEALKSDEYPSLRIFRDAGFTTIACTWFNPMNIYGFAEAARREGAWGLLQTTWAGYNLDEGALDREPRQFAAYILAAEYAWSGDSPPPDQLPWRADEVLFRALSAQRALSSPRAGFTTELTGWVALNDWMGLGSSADLSALRTLGRADGYLFKVADEAIVLGGNLVPNDHDLPRSVRLKLSAKATHLAMLHATSFPAERGDEVGRYEIQFEDGTIERVALIYGQNIRAWDDPAIARGAPGARVAKNDAGLTVAAHALVWTNPHPDKSIETITFATEHPYASPALLALSGLVEEAKR